MTSFLERKLKFFAIIILLAAVIFGILYFSVSSKRIYNSSTILTAIHNVKKLETVSGFFQSIADLEYYSKIGGWDIPFTKRKVLVLFNGRVSCGIDMALASISSNVVNKTLTIILPHAKIFDVIPDMESISEYHKEEGMFVKVPFNEEKDIVVKKLDEIKEEAVKNWKLLEQAENNAKNFLESFVRSINFSHQDMTVEIAFADDEELTAEKTEDRSFSRGDVSGDAK